jgi:hypothetical protein
MKFRRYGNIGFRVINKPYNICLGSYQNDASVLAESCHARGKDVDHGLRTFLLQRVTAVILSWFVGRTWKKRLSVIPNRLDYCVIFRVYIHNLQMWPWAA